MMYWYYILKRKKKIMYYNCRTKIPFTNLGKFYKRSFNVLLPDLPLVSYLSFSEYLLGNVPISKYPLQTIRSYCYLVSEKAFLRSK